MRIIGYAYDADINCVECAMAAHLPHGWTVPPGHAVFHAYPLNAQ